MSGTGTKRGMTHGNIVRGWKQRFKSAFCGIVIGLTLPAFALAQTAALLPNAKQQYLDDAANPIDSGSVGYYVPGSTVTKKTIWQDASKTTPQANPVPLDNAGRPQPAGQTYGDGCYQQVVKDANNIQIWSAVTCSNGSGSGGVPSTEGVMVGTIIPWANTTLPAKYLYTAGQAVSRTTYPELLVALTFNVNVLCSVGIATISVTTDISDKVPIGAPVELSCFAPGTVVSSKTSGQLTLSNTATTTASVNGLIFPWGNGNGSTTFNVPYFNGRVLVGRNNMNGSAFGGLTSSWYTTPAGGQINPNALNASAGSQNRTLDMTQLPATPAPVTAVTSAYSPVATVGAQPALGVASTTPGTGAASGGAFNTYNTSAFGSIQISGFSSLAVSANTANLGSGAPISMIQPSVTADYIIKALPDDSPTGPGVSSIGGMTGAIACGGGIFCNANTISIAPTGTLNTWPLFSTGPTTPPVYRAITGADLPNPSTSTLGGVFSKSVVSGQVLSGMDASGNLTVATNGIFQTSDVFGLAVGRQGATNPVLQVDASTASQVTGIKLTGQSTGNGFNVETIGSDANIPLIVNAKGNGTINFGTNSTGNIVHFRPSSHTGSTSGSVTVSAQAVAGTPALLWPNTSGTLVASAASPLAIGTTTGQITCPGCSFNVQAQIDLNTVGDTVIPVSLPTGITRYRLTGIFVINTSSTPSLTTAQVGVFTSTGGGGTAIVTGGTALTAITTNAVATSNATTSLAQAVGGSAYFTSPVVYFRVTTGQGSSPGLATVSVTMAITPVS